MTKQTKKVVYLVTELYDDNYGITVFDSKEKQIKDFRSTLHAWGVDEYDILDAIEDEEYVTEDERCRLVLDTKVVY